MVDRKKQRHTLSRAALFRIKIRKENKKENREISELDRY
jgi:hypothetical protein